MPPYVRWHRRIRPVACDRNPWDGGLTAHALLVAPLPAQLTTSRDWWRDRGWRDWSQTFGQYLEPTDQDLTRSPFLRTTLLVDAPVPLNALPPAPDGPSDTLADTAGLAVAAMVKELNELLNPIIRRLEDRAGTRLSRVDPQSGPSSQRSLSRSSEVFHRDVPRAGHHRIFPPRPDPLAH